jgi:phosphinothricin acetyltransferase
MSAACSAVNKKNLIGIINTVQIAEMTPDHWLAVRAIYLEGIATGNATFETIAPDWSEWDAKHLPHSRLVVRNNDQLIGWAALSPVSSRPVYRGVAEVSVYIAERARGRGVGRALLDALIVESERHGIWTLQAGIFPENIASIELHRRAGFREVGRRERIGQMADGTWRDTILLERRTT